MIDFNDAPEQKTGGGPIPPKSIVKVKLTIREPAEKKKFEHNPIVTVYKSGLLGLDCEFQVLSGTFEGNKIWENLFLPIAKQDPSFALSKGQEGICNSSNAKFRAIIEACRGIDPSDASQNAIKARGVSDWTDFDGMEFPAMIGVNKPKAGDEYINNSIMRIITSDKEDYQNVMGGGEFISELPFPKIPESKKAGSGQNSNTQGGTYQPPNQQNNQQQNNNQQAQNTQKQGGKPAWA